MKSDAILRFVSIRSPERMQTKPDTVATAPEIALDTFKGYIDSTRANAESAEEIVEGVILKVSQSSDYYSNNSDWKALLENAQDFQDILRAAAEKGNPDLFKSSLTKKLSSVLGESVGVDDIPQSELFANLKKSIWLSYYATSLSSKPLPGSLREIFNWIRFLEVVEVIDNAELLKRRLSLYHRIRPTLPIEIPALIYHREKTIRERTRKDQPKRPEKDNKAAAINTLQEKRNRQKRTRDGLIALQREKTADAQRRAQELRESELKESKAQDTNEKDKKRGIAVQASSPWHIEAQDLKGRDELRQLMEEFHLDADRSTLPQMIHRLDTAIAACNRRLAELHSEYVVIPVGRTLTRVKRRTHTRGS